MKRNKKIRIFATIVLGAIVLFTLFPILLLAVASFTDEATLIRDGYTLFPKKLSVGAYVYMRNPFGMVGRAYYVTLLTTVIGTIISMLLSSSLAYPMARSTFRYRNALAFFVYFTMLFNGGIVPSYILYTTYFKIKNTLAALIVPNLLMNAFNVMLVRNYYKNSIPEAMYEAAQLDGASELQTFVLVAIPLSVPVLSTVGLFVALAYWNSWTNALYYVTDPKLFGIQNLLMRIMRNIEYIRSGTSDMAAEGQLVTLPGNSIRMALALIGILPIILIYPFVQKYFVKGVIVGAVKG